VATEVGGIPDVVGHERDGLLVPPGRPDRLAEAIASLARSPERRQALGAAGLARVRERYRAGPVLARLAALYEEDRPHDSTEQRR
jgi:glycosyltransferase involved in cell wall biosynthesis